MCVRLRVRVRVRVRAASMRACVCVSVYACVRLHAGACVFACGRRSEHGIPDLVQALDLRLGNTNAKHTHEYINT